MDWVKNLAVQSYCFRALKKNEEVIDCLQGCGLARIELWTGHLDFSDPAKLDAAIELYRSRGVDIAAIGVVGLSGDSKAVRKYFEFAHGAGAKGISCDFRPDSVPRSYRLAEKLADRYEVNLGIHNHGGRHWLGSAQMLRQVFSKTSERIGLWLDTAWALDSREDPLKMIEEFGPRLRGIHIKDFVFDRARKPEDVVVGTGNLDLKKLFAALEQVKFTGCPVLEYEGDVNNPAPAVQKCVEAVKQALNGK
ncbi:MAG: sugar phosphate isomerase/epimerase [Planctomycetes bacterium]|nr:sugar phosphate isomerase/epimerase [Planctomycetota bacterium]